MPPFASHLASLPHPRDLLPRLPRLLAQPLVSLPFPLQRPALKAALMQLLSAPLGSGEFDFLQGHWLAVEVTDLDWCRYFSCDGKRRILISKQQSATARIRGELKSFLLLAAGQEDPDTLFFQRRLLIEGDTELGLHIKNLLDRVDTRSLAPELLFGLRTAAEYMRLFC